MHGLPIAQSLTQHAFWRALGINGCLPKAFRRVASYHYTTFQTMLRILFDLLPLFSLPPSRWHFFRRRTPIRAMAIAGWPASILNNEEGVDLFETKVCGFGVVKVKNLDYQGCTFISFALV